MTAKKLFLLDALGALLTALNLAIVLPFFQEYIGMPIASLYSLAVIASLFFCYSILCYKYLPSKWPIFLIAIAVANLLYCPLTIWVLFNNWEGLKPLGQAYFAVEFTVIMVLAAFELSFAYKNLPSNRAST